jgi:hypothetical protein
LLSSIRFGRTAQILRAAGISGPHTGVEAGLRDFSIFFFSEFSLWVGRFVGLEPKLKAKRVVGHVQILAELSFGPHIIYGLQYVL